MSGFNISFEPDDDSLLERYLNEYGPPLRSPLTVEKDIESPVGSTKSVKKDKRKSVFEDVTNQTPSPYDTVKLNAQTTPSKSSPSKTVKEAWRQSIMGIASIGGRDRSASVSTEEKTNTTPTKKRDRKDMQREINALHARVAEMEVKQVQQDNQVHKLETDLTKVVQERDRLAQENKKLKTKTEELQTQLDRYVSRKWKTFVADLPTGRSPVQTLYKFSHSSSKPASCCLMFIHFKRQRRFIGNVDKHERKSETILQPIHSMTSADSERKWELIQIKAFTAWLNEILSHRDTSVVDIKTDLSDGVKLIYFLETLIGKKVTQKWDLKPPSRIQCASNVHIALNFLGRESDVRLVGIGVEDFVDENLKMILGFLWSLYKKYRIANIKQGDKSSEEGLLQWVRETTDGYKDVRIENYRNSFKDGYAFSALIDKFIGNRELFDFDNSASKDDPVGSLERAFTAAEKNASIPRLLDPEEVAAGGVDERSMVLYLSLFFHAFQAKQQREALLLEQNRISDQMKGLEGRAGETAKRAEQLLEEKQQLELQVSSLEKSNKEATEKIAALESHLQRQSETHEREKAEMQENHDRQLAKERYDNEELRRQLAELQGKYDSAMEREKSNKLAHDKALRDLQIKLDALEGANAANGEEIQKLRELAEAKLALEAKLAELQQEHSEVSSSFEAFKRGQDKKKQENDERNAVQVSGLGILAQHLTDHIEDLHRWESYLDLGELPPMGELRRNTIADIKNENFEDQLKSLSDKLDKENAALLEVLKIKESEARIRREQEQKRAARQQKGGTDINVSL
ncbi:hypothetical protein PROFUN_00485 [Planoprotostelium fungivorum]|uniref:Calponin-homology (CH) domain-containing protein n=1 Tax=Planoprotostelium fungivorum TaxID=1890364 RepID=A0A2P6N0Y8_9EUKA|nr:hypothetical protein PROFUN_00485 [Planoprotostelium fungivorum]